MPISISQYLHEHGPSRSSLIVDALVLRGVSPAAARQRVSRARRPIRRFTIPLLPKREAFLYLESQRSHDQFWTNFVRDLRETGSVYGAAIDGLIARGGFIRRDDFACISSATVIPQKGQLTVELVAKRLVSAGFLKEVSTPEFGACYSLQHSLANGTPVGLRARDLTERILLDGVREWARKIGLASYNSIKIRSEPDLKPIGPFVFDLAGPSYLLPLQGSGKPGFLVADVFAEGILEAAQVQYFIRKARMLKSTLKQVGVLSVVIAEGFTGSALTAGHAAGIMLATPKDLFGKRVGAALASLLEVLKNSAAYASYSPDRLTMLLNSLMDIEGRSNNLRGVLFELVVGHLARLEAVSIDMNVRATDPETGNTAEIDVQQVGIGGAWVSAIECKGKGPGGVLTRSEVETWLRKVAIQRAFYRSHPYFREAEHRFEIWTSGTIAADALELLEQEKVRRVKAPISWKNGSAVLDVAHTHKIKGIADALNQHFLQHPLAETANDVSLDVLPGMMLPGSEHLFGATSGVGVLPAWARPISHLKAVE